MTRNNICFLLLGSLAIFFASCNRGETTGNPDNTVSLSNNSLLGRNVWIFDASMDMKEIQILIDTLYARQVAHDSEFNDNRYALLFKPGRYTLDVKVGYYMQILGLGKSPEDVVIEGAVRSLTTHHGNVLCNFWRGVENLTVIPAADSTMVWGVSQAAPMRRVHIKGNLRLFDRGYASGGFLADSKIDGKVSSGPQQQWFTRNTEWNRWEGGVWNMMFMGVPQAPEGEWPEKPYTRFDSTPVIREKPYIVMDKNDLSVCIPSVERKKTGPGWISGVTAGKLIPLGDFYIAIGGKDNAESMNRALSEGRHLLITPGRYVLDESLKITRPGTIVMGIGLASLMPVAGNAAIEMADIGGAVVTGLTIDAGSRFSEILFRAGDESATMRHNTDPSILSDIFFRVGGPSEGSAGACLVVNSNDIVIDHAWIWRADHGRGVGWEKNKGANGLIVNGNNVTIYGLFNEHFQEYQTIWNGEGGRLYFYQSEMPYDPPSVDAWKHGETYGYASYKVSDSVKSHQAWGVGIYNVFYDAPVIVDNAIETHAALEDSIHHKIIFWLNGNRESVVKSIINGKGDPVNEKNRRSVMR